MSFFTLLEGEPDTIAWHLLVGLGKHVDTGKESKYAANSVYFFDRLHCLLWGWNQAGPFH